MNHARSTISIGSDSSSPVRLSKHVVQAAPYGHYSSLGKPSPDSTAKTVDASSCTSSWSEYSGSSSTSRGATCTLRSFGRTNISNNNQPSFLDRSLDLESVCEEDEEQDEVSVITEDASKVALSVDMDEKDELIARLSLQVAELQQKVVKADKKKEKIKGRQPQQHTKPVPSVFLGDEEEATDSDEEDKWKKNAFPQLATVSTQNDLRSKFAKRGKSVRRFNSTDSLENRSVMSGDESVSSLRHSPKKKPQSVEQRSSRVQQAQLDLQKSFSMRGRSSRALGLSPGGGCPSNSSLDSRGSANSKRRRGRRPVPSPAFQENTSEDSSSESSDSDFESAAPTNLRRAFAVSKQGDDSVSDNNQNEQQPKNVRRAVAMKGQSVRRLQVGGSCDSFGSTPSYKSTGRRAQIVQDQSSTDSMESMSRGGPIRRMNLTEASKDDCRSTDSLESTNPEDDTETSSTEEDDDEPRKLRETWQSAMRKDLVPANTDGTVDDDESIEEPEEQQGAQKISSFHENGSSFLDMVMEEEKDEEEEEDTSLSSSGESSNESSLSTKMEQKAKENNLLVPVIEEDSVDDSESSIDTENVFVASHEHAPHSLTPPRSKSRAAAELDASMLSKITENSVSAASSTFAEDPRPAMADVAIRSTKSDKEGKGKGKLSACQKSSDAKDHDDDDILWSPSEFAIDVAFEQSNSSFASVSSSNANDEQTPMKEVSRSKTTATRRASFGILNERTADLDMDRVLTTLEDSFAGVDDDASVESLKKPKSRLAKIAKASFRLGKKIGAQPKVVNEDAPASYSSKGGLFKRLIAKKRMTKREEDQGIHEAGPTIDLALNANSNEIGTTMLAASHAPKSSECQFESSLLSIGYSSASSVFYADVGSLEDVPTAKAPRSSTNTKNIKGVFDMSKSGGEFEDLWKSKVGGGLDCFGRTDEEPVSDLNWEGLDEGVASTLVQDSCRRPEQALEEIERAIDRARSTQFIFELDPDVLPSAQGSHSAHKKSVSFNILLEEGDEADQFDSVVEVPRIETEPVAPEVGSGSPRRPQVISPVVRFRRPKAGRLRTTDEEAQQITLVAL